MPNFLGGKSWEYGQRPNSQYYRLGRAAIMAGIKASANIGMHRMVSSSTASSHSDAENKIESMVSGTEYGDGRRAPTYTKRLHDAMYVKCDHLFKDLFFPILNMNRNFGFCSTSGVGKLQADLIGNGSNTPGFVTPYAKANGCWRGLAMFTIRSNQMLATDAYKLNPEPQIVGETRINGTASTTIKSAYRRFNNGPQGVQGGTNSIPGLDVSTPQTLQWARTPDNDADFNDTLMSISEVGNLNDIEVAAVQSVNFQHAIGSSSSSEGTTTTEVREGTPGGVNWDGTGNITTSGSQTGRTYYPNLKNTTIRIADGCLEMDVTNGKNSSVILELVLHSQTKQADTFTPAEFLKEVYQSVEFQQNQDRVGGPSGTTTQIAPGGWQAFYDPTYPLLSIKSAHAKKAHDMYREVHRSIHCLAPGQSKTLKVLLGSHFYSLGNKSNTSGGTRMQNSSPAFPAGNLLVSIGHSGVSQLSMPTLGNGETSTVYEFSVKPDVRTNQTHTVPGTGFWVGKQRAPSEIIVQGSYKEKFYPAYVVSDNRTNYDDYVMGPPILAGGAELPAGLPVQETVATVSGKQSVPAKIATSGRFGEL